MTRFRTCLIAASLVAGLGAVPAASADEAVLVAQLADEDVFETVEAVPLPPSRRLLDQQPASVAVSARAPAVAARVPARTITVAQARPTLRPNACDTLACGRFVLIGVGY